MCQLLGHSFAILRGGASFLNTDRSFWPSAGGCVFLLVGGNETLYPYIIKMLSFSPLRPRGLSCPKIQFDLASSSLQGLFSRRSLGVRSLLFACSSPVRDGPFLGLRSSFKEAFRSVCSLFDTFFRVANRAHRPRLYALSFCVTRPLG